MVSFGDLGVATDLVDTLSAQGITDPFPIQRLAIPDAIAGRDVCGKAKTGSGKTLAFGLPLLMRIVPAEPGLPTALVLVPTRELAVQVHDVLAPLADVRGASTRTFYGGTPVDKDVAALRKPIDVAIATPGRLIDLCRQQIVDLSAVKTVVLDEADRMADMGFTPQVDWLLRRVTGQHQSMLFSATLDGDVDHLVRNYMSDPVFTEVEDEAKTVESMLHRFLYVHEMDKHRVAAAIGRGEARTLVFTRTKRGADRLVDQLRREGVSAEAIHGDLRQASRERALSGFTTGRIPVLVATDVAARGLHIDAVDTVLQYDLPDDDKTYLHRSGRTARAGAAGLAVTLVLWNELFAVRQLQKRLDLEEPVVEVFSNDPRLSDLTAWEPDPSDSVA